MRASNLKKKWATLLLAYMMRAHVKHSIYLLLLVLEHEMYYYVKNKFIVLLRFDPTSIFWYLSFILVQKKVPFIQYLLHHLLLFAIVETVSN